MSQQGGSGKSIDVQPAPQLIAERLKSFGNDVLNRQMRSLKLNMLDERAAKESAAADAELLGLGPKCIVDGCITFVVRKEGRIAGFIAVKGDGGVGAIKELRLPKGPDGEAVAKQLISEASWYMKTKKGCNSIHADIAYNGHEAAKFFTSLNFRHSEVQQDEAAEGNTAASASAKRGFERAIV